MSAEIPRTIDALQVRRVLGREQWKPPQPFGPDGWALVHRDGRRTILISAAPMDDGQMWLHASMAGDTMPTYEDLVLLHAAVFGDGYAYQVFVPRSQHVNIHQHGLHLWGRADGVSALPEFGLGGSI